ncbi:MAG: RdgB/HAM1 family non-canonical purine NTP pyrophosphatase [Saprospiraceae bacterium]|nr:MAG: nucleoside-triphosphatase rdgB [Bacteroidetes bacterium OLB9]MCO6464220.1 RdgB/HAM1 family non-canonical purine NTP pyrophosphatase [Saprospiraceae bacterium]MCZ2338077.1 RdgB/HAM1 family non-canonical purine NTP pyrophosphatase [Chitinophagales bacterium]
MDGKILLFATANHNKLKEIRVILPDYDIKGLADLEIHDDILEVGSTLSENAIIKAQYLFNKTGLLSLSEDTGLEVDALGGLPGVHTARYAGDEKDPDQNIVKLLRELRGKEDRSARFRTVIAMIDKDETHLFEGVVEGRIAEGKKGSGGFGYDPVFIPDGYEQTFAELSADIKKMISHRARAVKKLVDFLQNKN